LAASSIRDRRPSRDDGALLRRVLTGASLLGITLGAWWVDASRPSSPAWALAGLGVILTLGALYELLVMGGASAPQRNVGMVAGVVWLVVMMLAGLSPATAQDLFGTTDGWPAALRGVGDVLTAASAVAGLYLASRLRQGPQRSVVKLSKSLWFCVPYAAGLSCLLSLLLGGRLELVIGVVLVAKSSDIGAYFVGKSLGKRKLAPAISPGKTVEGLIGGLVLPTVVAAFLLDGVVLGDSGGVPVLVPGGMAGAALHGLAIAALTVVSDLSESLVKRSCDIKDSGKLFGESGGFLDLADSLLLVAPLMLAYTAVAS
jgi:CDP-diglyceride synthetase